MPLAEPSFASRARVQDFDQHMLRMNLADAAFDFAVIEENRLAHQCRRKGLGESAGNVREIPVRGGCSVFGLGQNKQVARPQADGLLDKWKVADMATGDFLAAPHQREFGAAEHPGVSFAGAEAGVIGSVDDCEMTPLPTAVLDVDGVPQGSGT